MVIRLFFTIILAGLLFAMPVRAAEQDCRQALGDYIAAPLAIVKGMADYKAAMDAGYAACMVHHPQEFAPLRPVNDFMQDNMQTEMTQARAVLDAMLAEPDSKSVLPDCAADEDAQKVLKEDITAILDGQYSKAYARRHRAMADADLVSRDYDSCLIVLDMVRKYEEYYGRYDRLENVLYESSKKQGKGANGISRRSFKDFERLRDHLDAP